MKTAVVICPGRGSYTKSELGYLRRYHADKIGLLEGFDAERRARGRRGCSRSMEPRPIRLRVTRAATTHRR